MPFDQEKSNKIWQNIRKRGELTCHGHTIPKKCSQGKCDNYPWVFICKVCNPCLCNVSKQ
jgi:hypothetical protein